MTLQKETPLMCNHQGHELMNSTVHYNPYKTDTNTQRQKILHALQQRPHSTFEFREMGICSPATRIMELKERGYNITTTRVNTHNGVYYHKGVAIYVLHGGAK